MEVRGRCKDNRGEMFIRIQRLMPHIDQGD